eukprot:CAMPEP_0170469104 /NCGR_PEP_ID=MMETSP0123-20130129/12043_1 /TAXON_ID=182087 /ORGANISM="Favella ehrenbergii, Strain Fehren 1" /LENGTH=66 /DNA_ID=CAMNT_0010735857 /DNA_START=206 /DNA_END=406 /DNA_ORIENTATION=+
MTKRWGHVQKTCYHPRAIGCLATMVALVGYSVVAANHSKLMGQTGEEILNEMSPATAVREVAKLRR